MILQTICAVCTAVTIGFMMTGCSSDKKTATESSVTTADSIVKKAENAEEILSGISDEKLDGKAIYGDSTFTENCKKLFGENPDAFSDGGIIYAKSGGVADEVSVLKKKDGSGADKILSDRLEKRKKVFENYKPEEKEKLEKAKIFQSGDYYFLVISDKAEEISEQIRSVT